MKTTKNKNMPDNERQENNICESYVQTIQIYVLFISQK